MSLVIATPLYGGFCTAEYADGMARLQSSLDLSGIKYKVLHHINDSLIPRARNCLVARFMRDPELAEYSRFMFIDADIQFEPEDVCKLWNLSECHDVVTACYPTKREDKDGTKTTAWKDGKLIDLDSFDQNFPVEIDYAGTGFLMINRLAFIKMQNAYPHLRHIEGHLGEVYGLFQDQPSDYDEIISTIRLALSSWHCSTGRGGIMLPLDSAMAKIDDLLNRDWKDRWWRSEDYTWCQRWRDIGGKIMLDPSIRLGHVGRKVFRG